MLTYPLYAFFLLTLSLFIMMFLMMSVLNLSNILLLDWVIFKILNLEVSMEIVLSKAELLFSITVLLISMSVMLFSSSYMSGEINLKYFIMMVMLFIMSMNLLIFIPNMMMLLIAWDGLGLTSYLLVIFFLNDQSLASGMITALSNRIGDSLLIMSLSLCIYNMNFAYHTIFCSSIIMFFLMIASFTKSAQLPFSAWLPAAMAAPTPVSALVHSSTLVTAGVFLLYRFYPSLCNMTYFTILTSFLGICTCFFSSASAICEDDLKKVIALSTLSQLGVMMFTLGLNMPELAFFHLLTHAYFKAVLFICAGTIIHNTGQQDFHLNHNISLQLPMTSSVMVAAMCSLCGFPFLSGFYSKDSIMEIFVNKEWSPILSYFCLWAVLMTCTYSGVITYTVLMPTSVTMTTKKTITDLKPTYYSLYDESMMTYIPYFILLMGGISGGKLITSFMNTPMDVTTIPSVMKIGFPFLIFFLFVTPSWGMVFHKKNHHKETPLALSQMWWLTEVTARSQKKILQSSMKLNMLEKTWMEFMLFSTISKTKNMMKNTQNLINFSNMYWLLALLFFTLLLLIFW
uniref:NADH-ubiquinone oxidoreductase chain 5 n=1 Tax=Membranipora grandicella TaxID=192923 RepID=I6M198_9BILA|nr:NADH dehydrogenase subunit 5 [Membranipora grandicella]AEH99607.1 NADH dehydrogenase subunit 5 [Membranipora grandicella]